MKIVQINLNVYYWSSHNLRKDKKSFVKDNFIDIPT